MIDVAQEYCYLTTTGRRSGTPHRIEIWFAAAVDRPTIYLLAGGRDCSDWVRNIRADATCTVEIGGRVFRGSARVLGGGSPEEEAARNLVHDKYANRDDLRRWRVEALPVAIDLREATP